MPANLLRPATALTAATALVAIVAATTSPSAGAAPPRPNVIVVMTDDQSVGELSERSMPATMKKIAGEGTTFNRSFVSSPLCCPSRGGYITGQYPHNNGVYDNEPGYTSLNEKDNILYAWMQAAGYRTAHVGRFLLNYDRPPPPGADYDTDGGFDAPAGVDDWYGYVGSNTHYYGATFSDNGVPVQLGPDGYTTRAVNRAVRDFVADAADSTQPFFLTVAPNAPHTANDFAKGYCGTGGMPIAERSEIPRWKSYPLPKPPSFGEAKIGDKPAWISSRPKIKPSKLQATKRAYRCALASLATVDRGVNSLVKQLDRAGELDNTAIFFTSDNGYFFGEHRIVLQKVFPYEEGIRVPLLARVPRSVLGLKPGAARPHDVDQLVNNLDLTATILDLANAPPCTADGHCRVLDGHSLLPLMRGDRPDWSRGRTLLLQLGSKRSCDGSQATALGLNNYYDGIRTNRYAYTELMHVDPTTGLCDRPEFELYDLKKDPYQLINRAVNPTTGAVPSPLQSRLATELAKLRNCSGPSCG